MSEENKVLVRDYFEQVWTGGDLDAAVRFVSADYVRHDPATYGVSGLDALKDLVAQFRDALPDLSFAIEDQIAEGDRVLTRWIATGTHQGYLAGVAPTGKRLANPGLTVQRIADGKIVEDWTAWDQLTLLEQLGVAFLRADTY